MKTMVIQRGKGKHKTDIKMSDFYKSFKRKSDISASKFSTVLRDLNEEMFKSMVLENTTLKTTPLGRFSIVKYRKSFLDENGEIDKTKTIINYHKTLNLWRTLYPGKSLAQLKTIKDKKVVYETNDHSNGYICETYWNRINCKLKGVSGYTFIPTRTNNRFLAKCLKDPDLEIDFYQK